MLRSPEFAVLVLWLIAIGATIIQFGYNESFAGLFPVYFVCTVGCLISVKRAKRQPAKPPMPPSM